MNDEQRKAYVAGVVRERAGIEQRLDAAKGADEVDAEAVAQLEGRIAAIDAELDRVKDEAKTPRRRAMRAV